MQTAAALASLPASSPQAAPGIAPLGRDYLARLVELGLYEGKRGDLALSSTLAPLVHALHHVLAGGEVQVTVIRPGHAGAVEDLQRRLACATVEANALSLLDEDGFVP
jgi:hypothetical protein